MSKERILLATILLCVAGLVLVFCLFLDDDPDKGAAPVDGQERSATDRGAAPSGPGTDGDPAAPDAAARDLEKLESTGAPGRSSEGVITGRVLSEFGALLEGAVIELGSGSGEVIVGVRPSGEEGSKVPTVGKLSCASDAEGRFRLEGVGAAETVKLHLSHSDYVPRFVKVNAFDGTSRDVGDLVLDLGGSISGFILNEAGERLEGAEVHAQPTNMVGGSFFFDFSSINLTGRDWKATTGADGIYTIRGLPPGNANLAASHADHARARKMGVPVEKGEETGGIDIVLPWGRTITGMVMNAAGEPVPDAKVAVVRDIKINLQNLGDLENLPFEAMTSLSPAKTDAEGRFRLENISDGLYAVTVSAETYIEAEQKKVEAGTDDLVFVLRKGGWVLGRVLDARTGEGVQYYSITVDQDGAGKDSHKILRDRAIVAAKGDIIDPLGAFCVTGLGKEEFSINIESHGFADETVSGLRVIPGEGMTCDIEIWKESIISGRLLSAGGEPVASGRLLLESPPDTTGEMPDPADIQEASNLLPGIEGLVDALSDDWDTVKISRSADDGTFVFRGVREGAYRVVGTHRSHPDSEPRELTLARGEVLDDVEIRLGLAGAIVGTVYAVDGTPLPGARVQASRGGGLLGAMLSGGTDQHSPFGSTTGRSDSEGRFRIKGLAPGSYQVWMVGPQESESLGGLVNSSLSGLMGQGMPGSERVYVRAGEEVEVDLQETVKCRITGTVREAGRPIPGMKVDLFQGNLGFLAIVPLKTTKTDRKGVYLFDMLEEGNYDVRLPVSGQTEPMKESVSVGPGQTGAADFALPSGRVNGRVTDIDAGRPLAGMKVSLRRIDGKGGGGGLFGALGLDSSNINVSVNDTEVDGGDELLGLLGPAPVQTGSDGRFEVRFVDEGEYELIVRGKGYIEQKRSPVKVLADRETGDQDFQVARGWSIAGRVIGGESGQGIEYCTLTIARIVKGESEPERVKGLTSDKEGRFSFSGLGPGVYRIKARDDGMEGEEIFTIEGSDVTELELSIW